jgi:hypothetical protein
MHAFKPVGVWMVALSVAAGSAGCHSRDLVRFQSHPTQSVVLAETLEKRNYLLTATAERAFWTCSEQAHALVCKRRCGGDTGYACPTALFFSNGVAPNVR